MRGSLRLGETVSIGYVDQSRDALAADKTVWEEISGGEDELILGKKKINSRAYASWFNFRGRDQQQKVGTLSGGQRNRLHLAKLLQRGCNLLLLDEPTNDLDVDTLRALEEALLDFAGLRRRDLARSLVPRSHRDAHPRLRRRQPGRVVRGQLIRTMKSTRSAASAPRRTSLIASNTENSCGDQVRSSRPEVRSYSSLVQHAAPWPAARQAPRYF